MKCHWVKLNISKRSHNSIREVIKSRFLKQFHMAWLCNRHLVLKARTNIIIVVNLIIKKTSILQTIVNSIIWRAHYHAHIQCFYFGFRVLKIDGYKNQNEVHTLCIQKSKNYPMWIQSLYIITLMQWIKNRPDIIHDWY